MRRKRPRDTRRSFVEALTQKYASDEQEGDQNDVIRISGRDVEEVGFDKIKRQQANLRGLKVIVLDGMRIGSTLAANISSNVAAGVAEYCPSCTRLDISRNLLESWDEISAIIEQLPALTELHVNGNRFGLRTKEPNEEQAQIFLNVKILGLDDCLLSWQDVRTSGLFARLQLLNER